MKIELVCRTDHSETGGAKGGKVLGHYDNWGDACEDLEFYENRYPACDMELEEVTA